MRSFLRKCLTVAINIVVLIALLGAIELYYRIWHPASTNEFPNQNGLWQKFHAYTMIMTAPGRYQEWENTFTHEIYSANIVTNSLGFNDPRVMLRSDHWGEGAHNALHVVGDFTQHALGERVLDASAEFPTRGSVAGTLRRFGERLRRWLGIVAAPQ